LFLVAASAASFTHANECLPVEGEPFAAELLGVPSGQKLSLLIRHEPTVVPAWEIVLWGRLREPVATHLVVLVDGGILAASSVRLLKDTLVFQTESLGVGELPADAVAGMILAIPPDQARIDQLVDRILKIEAEEDRVLLSNGDELAGQLQEFGSTFARLQTPAGVVEPTATRIQAIILNPLLRQTPNLQAAAESAGGIRGIWVGLLDGSRLWCRQLVSEGSGFRLELVLGSSLVAKPGTIVFLQPIHNRVVYLSDLQPSSFEHRPFLSVPWSYQSDRNVAGTFLRSGGQIYLKGLGVHSAARLVYTLEEPFERFEALIGIDNCTKGQGSVQFAVRVDGHERYRSPIIYGGQKPLPVRVELRGGKRLELLVDYADRADQRDLANWLLARLIRPSSER